MNARADRTTAWVLAGGGSLGAIQVGMLKALVAAGVRPDFLVGASVGAINAAYFAGDPTPAGARRLEGIWRSLKRRDVFPLSPTNGLLALAAKRNHFIAPLGIMRLIERELPYSRLEEAAVPCHIVATDLHDGAEVTLSSGSAASALVASTAIPGIFPPFAMNGRILCDGGVANHTPISTAIRLGARRLIVLPTGSPCALQRLPRSAIGMAIHALNLLIVGQLVRELVYYADQAELIVVPPLCPLSVSAYDFSQSQRLIERVEASTMQWLAQNGWHAGGIPDALLPHGHRLDRVLPVRLRKHKITGHCAALGEWIASVHDPFLLISLRRHSDEIPRRREPQPSRRQGIDRTARSGPADERRSARPGETD